MGSVHVSDFGIRMGTAILIFCSTLLFTWYLHLITASAENPDSQRNDIIEKNVVHCNVEGELVV